MNIIDIKVWWPNVDGYVNNPIPKLLVDHIPDTEDLVFDAIPIDNGVLYLAEKGGYVQFFFHDSRNERGYGGSTFTFRLRSGETRTVRGPWSSRAGIVNSLIRQGLSHISPVIDVSLTERAEDFRRGYTFLAGHCTVSSIFRWLAEQTDVNWGLELVKSRGEEYRFDPRPSSQLVQEWKAAGIKMPDYIIE